MSELPSYFKDNPWIEVLKDRKKEASETVSSREKVDKERVENRTLPVRVKRGKSREGGRRLLVIVPPRVYSMLSDLVEAGYYLNISDAVRDALQLLLLLKYTDKVVEEF